MEPRYLSQYYPLGCALEGQGTGGRFLAGARGSSPHRCIQTGSEDYLIYFTLDTGSYFLAIQQQERDDASLPSSGKLRTAELYVHSFIRVLGP
jgi:hypothetical protein